jgi:PEP-CTERM motif
LSDVRPSAQSEIPVGPSFGPVTYAPGYAPPLNLSAGIGQSAMPFGPVFLAPTGIAPGSIDRDPVTGLVVASSAGHGDPPAHHHHGTVPEPSSSLLLGLGFAIIAFAAWIKTRNE